MPKYIVLATLVFWMALHGQRSFAAEPSQQNARPNILFIAIDDLRPALGCYGDPLAMSPNIDRFAETARRFNHAYVQQAVCGPSRTSLLTGRLPDHTRVWHNRNKFRTTLPNLVTLPQLFKRAGYRSIGLGKIFSGNERELDPISWSGVEILRKPGWKTYILPENRGKGKQAAFENPDVADDAYPDGKLAGLAVETLEELNAEGEPFFLAVGFFKPHLPFNAPKKYWDQHDPAAFALPDDVQGPVDRAADLALHFHRELGGYKGVKKDEKLGPEQTQHLRHGYYACVGYADAQVGKVLRALERLDLAKNTIVVLWGDHGFALGESNRWCKGTNFELDTRVPLLIRTPDLPHPGIATNSLVEVVDLYPTLAALVKLEAPEDLDGRSFVPILQDPKTLGRDITLSQFNRPWKATRPEIMGYSIRTANKRYTRWIAWESKTTIAEELYDYASETTTKHKPPYLLEQQNIASSKPALLESMRRKMDSELASRAAIVD